MYNILDQEIHNDVAWLAREEFKLELTPHQADVLYAVYEQWHEQHNISWMPCNQGDGSDHDIIAGYRFLANSRDFDNHAWLLKRISS